MATHGFESREPMLYQGMWIDGINGEEYLPGCNVGLVDNVISIPWRP